MATIRKSSSKTQKRRITIKDVAKEAGVSIASVSYALNGTGSVGKDVKERIEKAIKKLGYRHNIAGRAMRTGKTNTIGLILPDLTNPFFPDLALAVERAAAQAGYAVFLINSENSIESEEAGLNKLLQHGVDGLVWCPASDNDTLKKAKSLLPIVVVDRPMQNYDCISSNYFQGGQQLAEHLIAMGHTKIGYISGPSHISSTIKRSEGFKEAIKGHAKIVWQTETEFSFNLNDDTVNQVLKNNSATVIVGGNDMIANSVIKLLRSNGKSVPNDISVSGFDNTPWSDLVTPSLTTMKQPIRGLGQEAVSMLMRRFEKPRSKKQNKFLEVDIIGRDSVAKL